MSILLRVRYDGTDFCGFARQEGLRTVQGQLESALSALYRSPILCRGASRTDSGVHAQGQLVAFDAPAGSSIPSSRILSALGGFLPEDLAVWDLWEQQRPDGQPLHPRFGNGGKRYRYRIRSAMQRCPLQTRYVWELRKALDVPAMQAGARHLLGEHDFQAFRAKDCQAAHAIRRIDVLRVTHAPDMGAYVPRLGEREAFAPSLVQLHVEGTAFLKHMVRIITGTLVQVGLGRRSPDWVASVLRDRSRALAGPTAPAKGLTLQEVRWTPPEGRLQGERPPEGR